SDFGDTNAVVHHVRDPPSVGTPGESRTDARLIASDLSWPAPVRRHRPQLHNAGIVFHEKGDARAVGRAAQPMARALEAGELPLRGEGQPPLGATFWRAGHVSFSAR